MKKLILTAAMAAMLGTAAQARTEMYGYQTWDPNSATPYTGPVKFDPATPADVTHIGPDRTGQGHVYGGYYYNYHWYGQVIANGTQSSVVGLYEIDMTTGERTLVAKGGSKLIDMSYDYSTGKVLGVCNGSTILGELDPATGKVTQLAKFSDSGAEVHIVAMTVALDGTIYGVGTNDKLYTVNRVNGACTAVGDLGYDVAFDQSMAFDYNTGILYWTNSADQSLYTVDTTTGKATLIGPISGVGATVGSLFIPYINVAKGAPDRVVSPAGSGATGSVVLTWTNPTTDAQGGALTALDGVRVLRDGVAVGDVKLTAADAGKQSTFTDGTAVAGTDYKYRLVPYNAAGDGGFDANDLSVRAGEDVPGPVCDLTAKNGDGSAILTWKAPVAGRNGGAFDPSKITGYIVKRGSAKVADLPAGTLTYEDKATFGKFSYTVAAVNAMGTGTESTVENFVVKPADWILMHTGEETIEDGTEYEFFDEGGPAANYTSSTDYVLTVAPANPHAYVVAEFTDFNIETYGDYLTVYDGRGTSAPKIGQFASTSLPSTLKHIESTAADGCLTFEFHADLIESAAGWKAKMHTVVRKAHNLAAASLSAPTLATIGTDVECAVTVMNKGYEKASAYTVEILDGTNVVASASGAALEPSAQAVINIKFKAPEGQTMSLTARVVDASDEDATDNVTEATLLTLLPKGSAFVELYAKPDETSQMYILPVSFMGYESLSQTLVKGDEVAAGKDMYLTAISFPYTKVENGYKDVPMTVWIGETDRNDCADGIVPASKLTCVFDGDIDITRGDEAMRFTFTTAYLYKGGNLVVMIHKHKSATNNSDVTFRGSYGYKGQHDNCTRFASNSYDDDPALDPENPQLGYSSMNLRPDMLLVFSPENQGVDDVRADGDAAITISGNMLVSEAGLQVYTPAGVLVAVAGPGESVTLSPGLYIAVSAGKAVKVTIR